MLNWAKSALLPTLLIALTGTCQAAENVAIEWRFDTEGDFRGWLPGGHVRNAAVTPTGLKGEVSDWDPIILGPVFEISATPTQCLEISMRTTHAGTTQVFWTETLEGEFGGFGEKKVSTFETEADGEFRTYRIHPFWHAAGKIIRLRLDPPGQGEFEIQWIRIVDEGPRASSSATRWVFDTDLLGWRAWRDASNPTVEDGSLHVTAEGYAPIIMSPLLDVSADDNPYVSIRMATASGSSGRVFCVSSRQFGWESTVFPLRADGKMHSYNVDVGHLSGWRDRIVMLGLQVNDAAGAVVDVESIEIAQQPRGPAEIGISYFGPTEGVNRAGRPAGITCSVRNRGGEVARNVIAELVLPEGVTILGESKQKIETLSRYLPKAISWLIESPKPGTLQFAVRLQAPGIEPVSSKATLELTPAPPVQQASYVPEPQPVNSKYDVGVFYFPGWHSMSRWQPILDFPLRKPVLGWYDESNPEVADWQIKWAVEHGVKFFMVDWYWSDGHRQLEHWLHDAYMNARHRKYLKWCVMWANHNSPNTHSLEDWRKVTQYWIDNYFGMEEYYRIDDRPAVFIWSPGNIRRDLGDSEQAAELYSLSQQMARQAGYKGVYFVAMSSHESQIKCGQLKSEGYEAFTSYHGFQIAAQRAGSRRFPFADVVETSPEVWQQADSRAAGLSYMPIVDSGWSSEPWHRDKALVISDRTPQVFGDLCRKAAEYADSTGKKIITVGPCNEWGEGSYIEPYAEYGFQDLAQLRDAFCPPGRFPVNLIPSDVHLGPYDLPHVEPRTAWEFDNDDDNQGWTPNGQIKVEVADGLLVGRSNGSDPILQGPGVRIEAAAMPRLVIRMRSSQDDRAQVFWATTVSAQSEANSARFDVIGDGQFHEYQIDLGKIRQWRGLITSLRFDPVTKPGVEFVVDYIRFR